ncbi:MAG TPA: hypothetical protein GXX72_04065 [Clostridiaceae bacterium]|nr:hypothetical protein [Clostridiaceae bacterium]
MTEERRCFLVRINKRPQILVHYILKVFMALIITITFVIDGPVSVALGKPDVITVEQGRELNEIESDCATDFESQLSSAFDNTGDFLYGLGVPAVGSIGGEWLVIGLLRAEYPVSKAWREKYCHQAANYIVENMDSAGRLHPAKSTENSRLILALTAMGYDASDFAGKNLIEALSDLEFVTAQGLNGPIWALLALDSHNYMIPPAVEGANQTTRENLTETILAKQLPDGGWAWGGHEAEPDITSMALQALAPYYEDKKVSQAVDKAFISLSKIQNNKGEYASGGVINVESIAQVITALTTYNINPATDSRFIKKGQSTLHALADFAINSGGFKHEKQGTIDGMASEQAYYALTSYYRLLAGKTSLYDMSDIDLSNFSPEVVTDHRNSALQKLGQNNRSLLIWVVIGTVGILLLVAIVCIRWKIKHGKYHRSN